ncbi:uncharacterized protein LOC143296183 [Babylonia areolata]|uniref:uncharacterized protein LOC143296183 n=1 Tax=Babylonia areolata TaxID=304850 RepID=UPI003FD02899
MTNENITTSLAHTYFTTTILVTRATTALTVLQTPGDINDNNDNDDDDDDDAFALLEKAVFCYANPIIFCIGVPANVLNCIVFFRQGLKDRMNLCLFCLSLVDLLFISFFTLSGSHCLVGLVSGPGIAAWWKWSVHKHVMGLYRGFLLCSGCLTMIISVERCVCVFLPLKAASLMRTRSMALLIGGTVVVIHLVCAVFPLKLDVRLVTDSLTNLSEYRLVSSAMYARNAALFDVIEHAIVMNGVPLMSVVVVGVCTCITIVQLKRVIVWRKNASSAVSRDASTSTATSQQLALVKMLVIVCCIFVTTSSPFVLLCITTLVRPEFFLNRRFASMFLAVHALLLVLGMINSSINFFVYLLRSSRFRQELCAVTGLGECFGQKKKKGVRNLTAGFVTGDSYVAGGDVSR